MYSHLATQTRPGSIARWPELEAKQMLSLGRNRGWKFRALGQAPLPEEPVRLKDWLIVPVALDSSPIPARTLERVQAIYAAGLRPQGFVLVHEAPARLAAPKPAAETEAQPAAPPIEWRPILSAMGTVLGVAAAGLAALGITTVVGVPLLMLLAATALVDPILIAITEDEDWIEIDRWLD